MMSYLVGRRLVAKYIPDRIAEWQSHVRDSFTVSYKGHEKQNIYNVDLFRETESYTNTH